MSFHPNDVARRGRSASVVLIGSFALLVSAFFKTQVLKNEQYVLQSEGNRLREVPLPAPRGIIYDRNGQVIAENLPGYSVSILTPTADSLRASLKRLSGTITLSSEQIESAVRRFRRAPNRPTVILADAPFDVVSVLEEHRVEFPGLIIQSAPKRYYPDGPAVASFVGYTGEINESELSESEYANYKTGQQIGKGGLEKQYESVLRGREGTRFVEVDARGRVVREAGARQDIVPESAPALRTNIDMDLQRFAVSLFGDSLQGGVVALDPKDGAVLALHSAPSFDPNRFIGGVSAEYYRALNTDERKPLYNKVVQGRYPPGSTWKLATSAIALQDRLVSPSERMPVPCTGGLQYGNRYIRCWDHNGHGSLDMTGAIAKSCDVYFYQLGLKMTLARLIAGGIDLGFREKSGIDLPDELRPIFPIKDVTEYYNRRYGPRGWTAGASVMNVAIGQGENAQTVVSMAKFYTALATDGTAARPEIVRRNPQRQRIFKLTSDQMQTLRVAMANVVSERGTANAARLQGVVVAGKTGTAQNSHGEDHAWFVGFAPADDPKIVVALMLEFGGHGSRAAKLATAVMGRYLHVTPTQFLETGG